MNKLVTINPTGSWQTFQGKIVKVEEMDHQHLSNIYHYMMYHMQEEHAWIIAELDKRFNGQLLDYRPHVSFEQEIVQLKKMGMLKPEVRMGNMYVTGIFDVVSGKIIGEIRSPFSIEVKYSLYAK